MTPSDRLKRTKKYASLRLREEIRKGPRGTQARLARELGVTTAHMTNLNSGKALPGEESLPKLAEHWGLSRDELEELATGLPAGRVNETIARKVREKGYTVDVAIEASRALGPAAINDADAEELIELTRAFLRGAARIGGASGERVTRNADAAMKIPTQAPPPLAETSTPKQFQSRTNKRPPTAQRG